METTHIQSKSSHLRDCWFNRIVEIKFYIITHDSWVIIHENISADTPTRETFDSRTLLKCVCIPLIFTIVFVNIVYLDQRQSAPNLSQLAELKTAIDSVCENLPSAESSKITQTLKIINWNSSKQTKRRHSNRVVDARKTPNTASDMSHSWSTIRKRLWSAKFYSHWRAQLSIPARA